MIANPTAQNEGNGFGPMSVPDQFSTQIQRAQRSSENVVLLLLISMSLIVVTVLWISFSPVDEIVIAQGNFAANYLPDNKSQGRHAELRSVLDAPISGIIKQHATPGDKLAEGAVVFEVDTTILKNDLKQFESIIEEQRSLLFSLQDEGQRKLAEIQLLNYQRKAKTLEIEISRARCRAPYRLVITRSFVADGNFVKPGEAVFQIAPSDRKLLFKARVSSSDIGKIQQGHSVEIYPETFDLVNEDGLLGRVIEIAPDASTERSQHGYIQHYIITIELSANQALDDRTKIGTRAHCVIHTAKRTSRLNQLLNRILRFTKS